MLNLGCSRSRSLVLVSALAFSLSVVLGVLSHVQAGEFAKGLAFYSSGKLEPSYFILEDVFSNSESTDTQKLHSAFILAFASNSVLTQHKRHFYAAYCLNHDRDFPLKKRAMLHRISGDGFFEERKFSEAMSHYLSLSEDVDFRNRAYAQYRLGWIELNQQQPALTFHRWRRFLKNDGYSLYAEDEDLLRTLIRDLGKAWTETQQIQPSLKGSSTSRSEAVPAGDLSLEINALPLLKAFEADFAEGIAQGLKRYSSEEGVEVFRKQLSKTSYMGSVFSQLLQKEIVFKNFPCEIQNWLTDSAREVQGRSLYPYFNACAEKTVEKEECENPKGVGIRALFEKEALTGTELLPRISLSIGCQQWDLACRDLIALARQHSEKAQSRLDPESSQALYEACSQPTEPVRAQLRVSFPELLQEYVSKNLISEDFISLLIRHALKDETLRTKIIQNLLSQSPLYERSFLPEELLLHLTEKEELEFGSPLLLHFLKASDRSAVA